MCHIQRLFGQSFLTMAGSWSGGYAKVLSAILTASSWCRNTRWLLQSANLHSVCAFWSQLHTACLTHASCQGPVLSAPPAPHSAPPHNARSATSSSPFPPALNVAVSHEEAQAHTPILLPSPLPPKPLPTCTWVELCHMKRHRQICFVHSSIVSTVPCPLTLEGVLPCAAAFVRFMCHLGVRRDAGKIMPQLTARLLA